MRPMLDLGAQRQQPASTAPKTNAQAYATGSDVHFGGGAAAAQSAQMAAHEAVHVAQQGGPRIGAGASVAAINSAVGHYAH